ncbi:hypothetical protein D3C79_785950 [compost metagenome]
MGLQQVHLTIEGDLRADPGIAEMLAENPAVEGAQRMMLGVYRRLPGLLARHMPTLFSLFTVPEPSILIHCVAGKDRTGVAVALLLHALGVEHGQIMADYLRSARRFCQLDTQRQQAMHTAISRMVGQPVSEAAINVVLDARPEYLNAAYAVIEAEYGGLEHYLARQRHGSLRPGRAAQPTAGGLGQGACSDPYGLPLGQGNPQQNQTAAYRVIQVQCLSEQPNRQGCGKERDQIHQYRGFFRAQALQALHPQARCQRRSE